MEPAPSYSVTLRVEYPNWAGSLGKIFTAIDERIVPGVAEAVAETAHDSRVSRPSLEEGDPMESPSLSQG